MRGEAAAMSWFQIRSSLLMLALVCGTAIGAARGEDRSKVAPAHLFDRDNLLAWCVVPFDGKHRGPEARAAMLERLGFRHFAYDWRAEHVPSFDAEMDALAKHKIKLDAFWTPGELNKDSILILDLLKRRGVRAELWVMLGVGDEIAVTPVECARRVEAAANKLRPLAEKAGEIGCSLALYNHGGWFGEPENQVAIIDNLRGKSITNVGMVYNLHHAQTQVGRLAATLKLAMPYLRAINLNGVDREGEPGARKILPIGQGRMDLETLRVIRDSGYGGPIGILGHTDDDAEERLQDNLDGLDWLVPQLDGKTPGPRPVPKTRFAPLAEEKTTLQPTADGDPAAVVALLAEARSSGDVARGASLFGSSKLACLGCHKVAGQGGIIGPDLSSVGVCVPPEEMVASVLWPHLKVKEGFEAVALTLLDGTEVKGYERTESPTEWAVLDPATSAITRVARDRVEARQVVGSLMPDGLVSSLSPAERRDLIRFLLELGRPRSEAAEILHRASIAATVAPFPPHDRRPIRPDLRPAWDLPVNRDRDYDFYAKQADFFALERDPKKRPALLAAFPDLDGGGYGHWGNQSEPTWVSDFWNKVDLGSVISGVFRGAGVTIAKAVCVRLGEKGEMAVCFNPETLNYEAAWTGGFVRFGSARHGFLDGLLLQGVPTDQPRPMVHEGATTYRGFYRQGSRVVFAYRVGDREILDAPTVEDGRFVRVVGPVESHPMRSITQGGGPKRWPEAIETRGKLGPEENTAYAIDSIEPPFDNPANSPLFFGGLDFRSDGSALLCTMQGEVWQVTGLDARLEHVRWRRVASGLHQALGLVVDRDDENAVYVLGRDQITRLRDLDGDGEADFHECVSNAYKTSTAGHDFIAGLERDAQGNFVTASGLEGVIRIAPDGRTVSTLATGFRNPDGLGMAPDGSILVPTSEGEWVPASSLSLIRPGGHFGYRGPIAGQAPDLPLVHFPRGMDNSSGAPVFVADPRMGALNGHWVHLSFGAGTAALVLRDRGEGIPQGAWTPLPGEFASGAHRGRVNPVDGLLYVAGMNGWGSYTALDGSFQRVRPTGQPARLPVDYQVHDDGVRITFSEGVDPSFALDPANHLAQAWNYRYGSGYGSPEYSPNHPKVVGHDLWPIRSVRVLEDGRSLFVEIPDLQPVSVLQLHLRVDSGPSVDLFATVHRLGAPFLPTSPVKAVAPHPIVADLAALANPPLPNPWAKGIKGARTIAVEAGKNLSFLPRTLTARPGEAIRLEFSNPDVVPHNWALIRPGTLSLIGELANKIIAQPDAGSRGYIPATEAILAYTSLTEPGTKSAISFNAPALPGRYPFLCTFPGHWMVMNGELIVE